MIPAFTLIGAAAVGGLLGVVLAFVLATLVALLWGAGVTVRDVVCAIRTGRSDRVTARRVWNNVCERAKGCPLLDAPDWSLWMFVVTFTVVFCAQVLA